VPLALYVDWKNLYKRPASVRERLRGEEPMTQFGRMCAKLGIAIIAASSPQAKGRVERVHGTHQDRLVKKLRRKGIVSQQAANVYLRSEYLPEHNRRFARTAARSENYHRRAPRAGELDKIFRLETERTVSDDWVVRYGNRFFQIEPGNRHYAPARSKVLVYEGRHGSIAVEYRGRALAFREIPAPVKAVWERTGQRVPAVLKKRKWIPSTNHPWNRAVRRAVQQRDAQLAADAPRLLLAGPALRPKRSALRAPQGYASGPANRADKTGMPWVDRDGDRRS
jgi:hypothetical protein